MLRPACNHGRALFLPLRPSAPPNATATATIHKNTTTTNSTRLLPVIQTRNYANIISSPTKRSKKYFYEPTNPLAHKLKDTGVWRTTALNETTPKKTPATKTTTKKKKKPEAKEPGAKKPTGDRSRINVTSESLVKDVISYLGPSLERHKGCDLISLYPGAGLWTKALHDAVQPRSHLLLEPDEDLYTPFLGPLLKQDGVRLIPKSGIVWKDLESVLTPEFLPHQKEIGLNTDTSTKRNDTLLVSINLAMFPRKKYQLFESLSRLVTYQLVNSMRTSNLFQKYGQVRMLVWIPDDEKESLLPRTIHYRKRLAIEAEMSTEYIGEVCGADGIFTVESKGYSEMADHDANRNRRWGQLELESVRMAMLRMRDQGFVTPEGRETRMMQMLLESGRDLDEPIPPTEYIITQNKKAQKEYDEMLAQNEKEPFDRAGPDYRRLKILKNYLVWRDKNEQLSFNRFLAYNDVVEAYGKALRARNPAIKEEHLRAAKELEAAFNAEWEKTPKYLRAIMGLGRDQARMMHHQPAKMGPVLSWDRRPYEPLTVTPFDFFPNIPCALLDLQPKAIPASLRAIGPGTNNAGSIFDLILGVLLQRPNNTVEEQLDIIWPGAAEDVGPQLRSLTDPRLGGAPLTGSGGVTCRGMNQYQLLELLDAYVRWPFRPQFSELVGRLSEDRFGEEFGADEDDGVGGHALMVGEGF